MSWAETSCIDVVAATSLHQACSTFACQIVYGTAHAIFHEFQGLLSSQFCVPSLLRPSLKLHVLAKLVFADQRDAVLFERHIINCIFGPGAGAGPAADVRAGPAGRACGGRRPGRARPHLLRRPPGRAGGAPHRVPAPLLGSTVLTLRYGGTNDASAHGVMGCVELWNRKPATWASRTPPTLAPTRTSWRRAPQGFLLRCWAALF